MEENSVFASGNDLLDKFDFSIEDKQIVIDFTGVHIWNVSSAGAIDLRTSSQKLGDQLAIFKNDNSKLPTHYKEEKE